MMRDSFMWPGVPLALGSAALFGASTPLAKMLLGDISPWLLAGLLYLGSGIGLAVVLGLRKPLGLAPEAMLERADWPLMAAVIVVGGVAGPLLLMLGLSTTPASTVALLLNLEGVFTLAIAWIVFRENVDRRVGVGAGAILVGAALLSGGGVAGSIGWGAAAVAAACLAWAIDNNLTRRLAGADPLQIAMLKGLVAGGMNTALGLASGARWPTAVPTAAAGAVGFLGYGVSLVMFVLALRHLGAARTGAYFSLAPFAGAALAVIVLGEQVTWQLATAAILMGVGLWLHLAERHGHEHIHEPVKHSHRHVHDVHHQHSHNPDDPSGEPHVHMHTHARLIHRHPHYPDTHHQHAH